MPADASAAAGAAARSPEDRAAEAADLRHASFALEIAARTSLDDPFAREAKALVGQPRRSIAVTEKAQLYSELATLCAEHADAIEYGCWDYFDEPDRAIANFEMWKNGMVTHEGARTAPSIDPESPPSGPRYLALTMAFLLLDDSPSDFVVSDYCQIPSSRLWDRDVFRHLFELVLRIDFADVHADVLYMIPNDPRYALTREDLAHPKFEYLRPVTGG